ncbi:MAG: hypothetical protein GF384_06780 [Elusimicrobia bacterium]|nr:hypothetical protein [Elusimicrobiota bacterium]MBD3412405.1 hypothetical protein [Elusimicrobiota bacterium]
MPKALYPCVCLCDWWRPVTYRARLIIYAMLAPLAILVFLPGVGAFCFQHFGWWVCVLLRTFFFSFFLCPVVEHFGIRFKFLDYPERRKIHQEPIPRIGGLAIYLSLVLVSLRYIPMHHDLLALLIGSSIIFFTGMVDDMRSISSIYRLTAQVCAAGVLIFSGLTIDFVPHIMGEHIIEIIITFIWIIGITNAVNFLDGINGLVSGMGALCGLMFLILSWNLRQNSVVLVTVALAGGCLGFIPYNYKFWLKDRRASLFLGDEGSTLIGFLLAGIAVKGTWAEANPVVALSTPLLILGIPIFDMIYTTISRIKNNKVHNIREWLDYVGKDHFHHRLMNLGFGPKSAVLFVFVLNICLGLSALIIPRADFISAILLLIQAVIVFLIIVVLMLLGRKQHPAE